MVQKLNQWLWNPDASFKKGRFVIQLLYRLAQNFLADNFKERAQSLTYTTMLSLVPLIAISFSVLKGFGVHHELIPYMVQAVSFLGEEEAQEMVSRLIGFVDNARGAVVGGVGMLFFFYTVVGLISTIEGAFNRIWGVIKGRSFRERIMNYLLVVLLGPVVIFALISLASNRMIAQMMGAVSAPGALLLLEKMAVIGIMTGMIMAAYLFITNKRVQFIPALVGALIASLSWYLVGKLFTHFVVLSGKQSQIYSGFASVVLFIMWMYLSWLIILIGNQIAYYLQYPEALTKERTFEQQGSTVTLTVTLEAADYHHQEWRLRSIEQQDEGVLTKREEHGSV